MFEVNDKVYFYNVDEGEYYPAKVVAKDIMGNYTIKCLVYGKWIEFNNIASEELSHRDHTERLEMQEEEAVNNPAHYNKGNIEVIDAIEDWDLNFCLGNAVKYIARCNHKGNKAQDIKKAIWYLSRELQKAAMKGE